MIFPPRTQLAYFQVMVLFFGVIPCGVTMADSNYDTWTKDSSNHLTLGVNDGAAKDPDGDGIANILEYILGGVPNGAGSSNTNILPKITISAQRATFSYIRDQRSLQDTSQAVNWSSSPGGPWNEVVIPPASAGSVTVQKDSPRAGVDTVVVVLAESVPAVPKIFARLKTSYNVVTISGETYAGSVVSSNRTGQWYLNGNIVSGETGISFTIPYTVNPGDVISQQGSNSLVVPALDYYVDAISGSDTNNGTSIGTPYSTLTPLTQKGNLGGKSIGIKSGTTLYSRLAVAGGDIRVTSYGGGQTPIIDCRDTISGFTKTAGYTSIYQKTVALPGDSKVMGNAWEDSRMLKQVSSLEACDATPGSCYVTSWAAASATLYLNTTASSDPGTNGKVYRYSARSNGIQLTGTNARVTNIRTIGNGHQDGGIVAYGTGAVIDGVRCDDGSRQSSLFAPNVTIKNSYFYRGRNDLEDASANGAIIYAPTITGTSVSVENTTFEQGDGGAFTGISGHGSPGNQLFASVTYKNCKWLGCSVESGMNATDGQVVSPVFVNCNVGFGMDVAGGTMTLSNGSGTINRLIQCLAGGTVNSNNGKYSIPVLGQAASVGFYRTDSTSLNVNLNINGDELYIQNAPVANADVIYQQKGNISVQNMKIGPALAVPMTYVLYAGFSDGTATYTGSNNKFPLGSRFYLNGTTYQTLAEWQAAGHDLTSTTQPMPAIVSQDNFNRADQNLDVSWTRVDGAAAQAAVRSNQMATLGVTNTFYRRASLSSSNQWVRFTTGTANGSGSFVVLHALNSKNWIGLDWSNTTWRLSKRVNDVMTYQTFGTTSVVPSAGQDVIFAIRNNVGYLYVNGRLLSRADMDTALGGNTGVGVVSQDTARNPWIDNFSCGILDP